jgi:DNA repair protein RecO (recombination protein O)
MKPNNHSDAIVLRRTNYGEADRIITFLTKDYGKVRAIAKGVRKERSKLAGGIEPFCVSTIGFTASNRELSILTSARLQKSYTNILSDYDRLEFAYECLKQINKITETVTDGIFFDLLQHLFTGLQNNRVSLEIIMLWWFVHIAEATGHGINVEQAGNNLPFNTEATYIFDIQNDYFVENQAGTFIADHIKLLRLAKGHTPALLANIKNGNALAVDLLPVVRAFVESR